MIFISYASKDFPKIEKYINKLKNKFGDVIWFAPERINSSEHYAKEIIKAIKNSEKVIVFLSKNAFNSPHVSREFSLAISNRKKIYPLRIENDFPDSESEDFEYYLSTVQFRDIFNEKEFNGFLNEISKEYEINVNEYNFENFVKLHFEKMGYKVTKGNGNYWNKVKEGFKEYDDILIAKKEKTQRYIVPIYKEKMEVGEFKLLEAELLWKYKDLIFDEEELKELFKEFKIKNPTFKQYMLFANKAKNLKKRKLNLLFYLYIKHPPKYKKMPFEIPLKSTYKEDEKMPQIFLNYTYALTWWGVGKDDLESMKSYKGLWKALLETLQIYKSKQKKKMKAITEDLRRVYLRYFLEMRGIWYRNLGLKMCLGIL